MPLLASTSFFYYVYFKPIYNQSMVDSTNSNSNIVIPRDGGPLSHYLSENNANHTSTDKEEVIPPVTSYSNLPLSVPSIVSMSLYPNTNIPSNFNPYFNPYQNNINPQISKPETQESPEPKPEKDSCHFSLYIRIIILSYILSGV
jgi:hypothetical protein